MPAKQFKPRPRGTLVEAQAALIEAAGGAFRLSGLIGRSQTTIQAYSDPHEHRPMPVELVLLVETIARQPIVTRFLAAEHGCVLLEVAGTGSGLPLAAETAALAGQVAEFFQALSKDLADGEIDGREAGGLIAQLDDVLQSAAAVRAALAARREGALGTEAG